MSEPNTSLPAGNAAAEHWTARFSRPVIFVILTLITVGVYLAFTIPVAVFPTPTSRRSSSASITESRPSIKWR